MLLLIGIGFSSNVTLEGGKIYYANATLESQTQKWVGLNIVYKEGGISTFYSNSTGVYDVTFLKSDFTVVIPNQTTFDYTKLQSVNATDLLKDHLFSSSLFPVFYPNYYSSDGPNATFCCNLVTLVIKDKEIKAFEIKVAGESEYLAKYNGVPAFIITGASHMILPVNTTYYIYSLVFVTPKSKPSPPISISQPSPKEIEVNYKLINSTYYFYVSSNGTPIAGAVISIYKNGEKIAEVITDENGVGRITLEEGEYTVIVSKIGYESKKIVVSYFPEYEIKMNSTIYEYGSKVCFSIYKNNVLTSGNVSIKYPNGTLSYFVVNGTFCFNATQWGIYEIKFKSKSKSFGVYFLPPEFQLPTVKEKPAPWMLIMIILLLIGLLAFIFVPIIIYLIKKRKRKNLFKKLLTR